MKQVAWALNTDCDSTELDLRWKSCREVTFEWNDNINRYSALLQIYFDEKTRHKFGREVGKIFVENGKELESLYKERKKNQRIDNTSISNKLNKMGLEIYNFNILLLTHIRKSQSNILSQ